MWRGLCEIAVELRAVTDGRPGGGRVAGGRGLHAHGAGLVGPTGSTPPPLCLCSPAGPPERGLARWACCPPPSHPCRPCPCRASPASCWALAVLQAGRAVRSAKLGPSKGKRAVSGGPCLPLSSRFTKAGGLQRRRRGVREGRKGTLFDLPCCALLSLVESCGEEFEP